MADDYTNVVGMRLSFKGGLAATRAAAPDPAKSDKERKKHTKHKKHKEHTSKKERKALAAGISARCLPRLSGGTAGRPGP